MRLIVWSRDKQGSTPKDLAEHPDWEGRHIQTCAADAVPRVGESIDLAQAEDEDDVYEVLYVCHKTLRREVYVEIEWVPNKEERT